MRAKHRWWMSTWVYQGVRHSRLRDSGYSTRPRASIDLDELGHRVLTELFNASLRQHRRGYWRPGNDTRRVVCQACGVEMLTRSKYRVGAGRPPTWRIICDACRQSAWVPRV